MQGRVEIVSARRKNDMAALIEQQNDLKRILIKDANSAFFKNLQYSKSEIEDISLFSILEENTCNKIKYYIEYEEYGIDICSILSKINRVNFIRKDKENIEVKIKSFPVLSKNINNIRFEILARNLECFDLLSDYRKHNQNFDYHFNEQLRIIDQESTKKELSLIKKFCLKKKQECSSVILNRASIEESDLANIITKIKSKVRYYDIVGAIDQNLYIVLVGCNLKHAKLVESRLLNCIGSNYGHKNSSIRSCADHLD